jgi:hypothetical protein
MQRLVSRVHALTVVLACILVFAAFYGECINNEQHAMALRAEVQNRLAVLRDRLEGTSTATCSW